MNTREATKQFRLNQWTEIVRECIGSGQTVTVWCADHDINPKKYYYWLNRVRTAACEALTSLSTRNNPIVPVTMLIPTSSSGSPPQESSSDITICFGAVTLELHNSASATLIENTVRALQNVR